MSVNNGVSQIMLGNMISRIKNLVKVYPGRGEKLAKIRMLYAWLEQKVELVTFNLINEEIQHLENDPDRTPTRRIRKVDIQKIL